MGQNGSGEEKNFDSIGPPAHNRFTERCNFDMNYIDLVTVSSQLYRLYIVQWETVKDLNESSKRMDNFDADRPVERQLTT